MKRRNAPDRGLPPGRTRAFTLTELLAAIAVVSVLAALLFPAFAQARDKARASSCLSNGKQIGLSYLMYMQDHDGGLPLSNHSGGLASWIQSCQPYIRDRGVYRCPSDASETPWARTEEEWSDAQIRTVRRSSYFLNAWLAGSNRFGADGSVVTPALVIYLAESADDSGSDHFHPMCWGAADPEYPGCARSPALWDDARSETREIALRRHQEGSNYLYLDGHAYWARWGQVYWQDAARGVYEGGFDPRQ